MTPDPRDGSMAGWRTIDSAPKDGTWMLMTDGTTMVVAHWSASGTDWLSRQDWTELGLLAADVEKPTHWMPLPSLPSPPKVADE